MTICFPSVAVSLKDVYLDDKYMKHQGYIYNTYRPIICLIFLFSVQTEL